MSSCTTTVPNSVRNSDPVGHTSRQAADVQCLHTSDDISQRTEPSRGCSMNATWRHVEADRLPVLSYESPRNSRPSSGTWFHSLHATSHALHPMHMDVSVKKPTRSATAAITPAPRSGRRP